MKFKTGDIPQNMINALLYVVGTNENEKVKR